MKMSIIGMGYVGAVSGACFAKIGHEVIGVDCSEAKVNLINDGMSPIIEEDIAELMKEVTQSKKLRATRDLRTSVIETDVSLVCVGTPSNANGSLDLKAVKGVCQEIGEALKAKGSYHVVVIRSTVLPTTTEKIAIPILEAASGLKAGEGFGVCFNPEFLREASSIKDFYNPPFTIIGGQDERAFGVAKEIYREIKAPLYCVNYRESEMVKYACNNYHALKITFANEIGRMCKAWGMDGRKVMEIFVEDDKLNVSKAYLKPGFAFGGSCLPKDLRATLYGAKMMDVDLPLLGSLLPSNEKHIQAAIAIIRQSKKKKIGLVGLSFKAGTDDLRESPHVIMAEYLIGKGYDLKIYDENVSLAKLVGANKEYIEKEIPHISSILTSDVDDLIGHSELIIVGNHDQKFKESISELDKKVILLDLANTFDNSEIKDAMFEYHGICWM